MNTPVVEALACGAEGVSQGEDEDEVRASWTSTTAKSSSVALCCGMLGAGNVAPSEGAVAGVSGEVARARG
eukprot:7743975-Alexandrium_andersonii.AAC.1